MERVGVVVQAPQKVDLGAHWGIRSVPARGRKVRTLLLTNYGYSNLNLIPYTQYNASLP